MQNESLPELFSTLISHQFMLNSNNLWDKLFIKNANFSKIKNSD